MRKTAHSRPCVEFVVMIGAACGFGEDDPGNDSPWQDGVELANCEVVAVYSDPVAATKEARRINAVMRRCNLWGEHWAMVMVRPVEAHGRRGWKGGDQ